METLAFLLGKLTTMGLFNRLHDPKKNAKALKENITTLKWGVGSATAAVSIKNGEKAIKWVTKTSATKTVTEIANAPGTKIVAPKTFNFPVYETLGLGAMILFSSLYLREDRKKK